MSLLRDLLHIQSEDEAEAEEEENEENDEMPTYRAPSDDILGINAMIMASTSPESEAEEEKEEDKGEEEKGEEAEEDEVKTLH